MSIQNLPHWMIAYHMVQQRDNIVSGKDVPEADRYCHQLLTADKVLINDDYLDRMMQLATERERYQPLLRLNGAVDGTWFEVEQPTEAIGTRFGFLVYDTSDAHCKLVLCLPSVEHAYSLWSGVEIIHEADQNAFSFGVIDGMKKDPLLNIILITIANMIGAFSLFGHEHMRERKLSRGTLRRHGIGQYRAVRVRYVSLTDPKPPPVSLGGTHASPARHTVKGYWRFKGTPLERWVAAYKRGNPAYGEIVHEYGTGKKVRLPPVNA